MFGGLPDWVDSQWTRVSKARWSNRTEDVTVVSVVASCRIGHLKSCVVVGHVSERAYTHLSGHLLFVDFS
jgi:hypothetical protein